MSIGEDLWDIAKIALATLCALCILMGCGGQRRTIIARICFPERYHAQQRARRALAERQLQPPVSSRNHATHDHGIIATQAGLQGVLTYAERERVLERIFEERIFTHAQMMMTMTCEETTTPNSTKDPTADASVVSKKPLPENATCSICLTDYTPKDRRLVRGMHCAHVHHYECCMEWMKQASSAAADLCPYCRQPLFTAEQMRTAAKGVIGSARVERGAVGTSVTSRTAFAQQRQEATPATAPTNERTSTNNATPVSSSMDEDEELGTNNSSAQS